jgi:DNA repair exonuclease SbcCD ATPase subunit
MDPSNAVLLSLNDEWTNYVTNRTDPDGVHAFLKGVEWQDWFEEPTKLYIQQPDIDGCQQLKDLISKRNAGMVKQITAYESARHIKCSPNTTIIPFSINTVSWSWLLSYGAGNTLSLDNREGHITLISGKNGNGKTALLEIICIGLFAESFPSRKSKAIINERAPEGEKAVVAVEFQLANNERYKVERRFSVSKSGGLTQSCDIYDMCGVKVVSGATQVNAWMSGNVGTLDEFLGSCMVTQANDASFLSLDPKAQLSILSRMLSEDTATAITDLISDAFLGHDTCSSACGVAIEGLSSQLDQHKDSAIGELQTIADSAEREMNALSARSEFLQRECIGVRRELLDLGMMELTSMLARSSTKSSQEELQDTLKTISEYAPHAKPTKCDFDVVVPTISEVQAAAHTLSTHLANSVAKPTSTSQDVNVWTRRKRELLSKISQTGIATTDPLDIQAELDKLNESQPPNPPLGIDMTDKQPINDVTDVAGTDMNLTELIQMYEGVRSKAEKLARACKWSTMQEYEIAREAFEKQVDMVISSAGGCDIEELAQKVAKLQRLERIVSTVQAEEHCGEYTNGCPSCMRRQEVVKRAAAEADDAVAQLEAAGTKSADLAKLVDKLVSLVDEQDTLWDPEGVRQRKRRRTEKELMVLTKTLNARLGDAWGAWRARQVMLGDAILAARELEAFNKHWEDEAVRQDNYSTWETLRIQYDNDLNHKAGVLYGDLQQQIQELQQVDDVKAALEAVPHYIELTKDIPMLQRNVSQRLANAKAAITAQRSREARSMEVAEQIDRLNGLQIMLKQRRDTLALFRSMWKGFQTYMLAERVLPALQSRINTIMGEVCVARPLKLIGSVAPDGSKITWAIEDVKGFTRAPLEKASGFQLSIASLATRIAVGQLVGTFRPQQLFIDEGFASCDVEHLERIPSLLRTLIKTGMYSAVFIVTHNDRISAHVDGTIAITRVSGVSRVVA